MSYYEMKLGTDTTPTRTPGESCSGPSCGLIANQLSFAHDEQTPQLPPTTQPYTGDGAQPGNGDTTTTTPPPIPPPPPLPGMPAGRPTKQQVNYMSQGPPPLVHEYKCMYCAFFQKEATTIEPSKCAVVDGDIDPNAWCMLWIPSPVDPPFMWLIRKMQTAAPTQQG